MDKSTDKLRDHVCDKGERGSKNSKFSWTSLIEAPLAGYDQKYSWFWEVYFATPRRYGVDGVDVAQETERN